MLVYQRVPFVIMPSKATSKQQATMRFLWMVRVTLRVGGKTKTNGEFTMKIGGLEDENGFLFRMMRPIFYGVFLLAFPECTQLTAFRSWFQTFWMFTQKRVGKMIQAHKEMFVWNWALAADSLGPRIPYHLKEMSQVASLGHQEHHSNGNSLWIGKDVFMLLMAYDFGFMTHDVGCSTHIPNSNRFSLPSQCLQKICLAVTVLPVTMILGKVCFFVQGRQGFLFEDMPTWWFQLW